MLVASLVAVIKAFQAVGAVSESERRSWMRRVREAVETIKQSRHLQTPATATAVAGAADVAARTHPIYDSALPGVDPIRVVDAPTAARSEGLRIVCVEEYAEGVVLRWNLQVVPAEDPTEQLPQFELRDDAGSTYHVRRRRAGGGPIVFRGETFFSPAVPKHASELRAKAGPLSYVIPLGSPNS